MDHAGIRVGELDVMDQIHKEFNKESGTDFEFPLRPKDTQSKADILTV